MDLRRFQDVDLVLVCGLPGSGKSHFAKTYFQADGRKRVNRKEIRRMLFEMTNFGDGWSERHFDALDDFLVKHVERKIIEHLLQNRNKVLIDNTSVSAGSRKFYVNLARQMRKTIGIVFLHTSTRHCLENNRRRVDAVPEMAISNLAAALELPRPEEGFKEVLVVEDP
jgi:bifunctional polynucleotide phosphatase/kinase